MQDVTDAGRRAGFLAAWDALGRAALDLLAPAPAPPVVAPAAAAPDLGGQRLCGPGDPYYEPIASAPAHPDSAAILAPAAGLSLSGLWHPTHYGFPVAVVAADQPLVPVDYDQDDLRRYGVAAAPIPDNLPLEGTAAGDPTPSAAPNDQHGIVVVRDGAAGRIVAIYEGYSMYRAGGRWRASRLIWRYAPTDTAADRPDGWPTTTVAGTRILPGLVTWDDVHTRGEIGHALRMTWQGLAGCHVPPARCQGHGDPAGPPCGTRLRLRADLDLSPFTPACRAILRALQRYGAILDDNGWPGLQLQGTRDARWKPYEFNDELARIRATDFEVLDFGPGYVLTPGVPGSFGVRLADPVAGVGVGGGEVGGLTLDDGGAGGGFLTDDGSTYRVTLTSAKPSGWFAYTPPPAAAPGTRITLSFGDGNLGRVVPAPVAFAVPGGAIA